MEQVTHNFYELSGDCKKKKKKPPMLFVQVLHHGIEAVNLGVY